MFDLEPFIYNNFLIEPRNKRFRYLDGKWIKLSNRSTALLILLPNMEPKEGQQSLDRKLRSLLGYDLSPANRKKAFDSLHVSLDQIKAAIKPSLSVDKTLALFTLEQQIMLGTFVHKKGQLVPLAEVRANLVNHVGIEKSLAELRQELEILGELIVTTALGRNLNLHQEACCLTNFDPTRPGRNGDLPRLVAKYAPRKPDI